MLSRLPLDTISKLQTSTLSSNEYDVLKEAVIQMHERRNPEMFANPISNMKMTGRSSDYHQGLLSTTSKVGVGEKLVQNCFIEVLTPNISPDMTATRSLSISKLETMADEIIPFIKMNSV